MIPQTRRRTGTAKPDREDAGTGVGVTGHTIGFAECERRTNSRTCFFQNLQIQHLRRHITRRLALLGCVDSSEIHQIVDVFCGQVKCVAIDDGRDFP